MRKDACGNECPGTLGEYRDLCDAAGITNNAAVALLDDRIATSPNGRDEEVVSSDEAMRALLIPLLGEKAK